MPLIRLDIKNIMNAFETFNPLPNHYLCQKKKEGEGIHSGVIPSYAGHQFWRSYSFASTELTRHQSLIAALFDG